MIADDTHQSPEAISESAEAPQDSPAAAEEAAVTVEDSPETPAATEEAAAPVEEAVEILVVLPEAPEGSPLSSIASEWVVSEDEIKRAKRFGEVLGHTLASLHSTVTQRGVSLEKAEEWSQNLTSNLTRSMSSLLEGRCD